MEARISQRTVYANILTLLSGSAIGQITVALALLLSVRAMGPNNTGQYLACFALAKLTSLLFTFGLDTWLLKEGSSRPTHLRSMVSNNLALKAGLGILWLGGLIGLSILLDAETYPLNLIVVAALTTWLESIIATFSSAFKTTLSNRKVAAVSILSSGLLLASTIVLIRENYAAPLPYATLRLIVGVLFALISFSLFVRDHQLPIVPREWKVTLLGSRAYFISDAMTTIYTQADITIVAMFLGKSVTGMYGSASRIITFLFLVPYSIFSVMVPVLNNFYAKQIDSFMGAIRRMMVGMTIVGASIWLFLGLFSTPLILLILGPEYIIADRLLNIMSPILFVKTISFGAASILIVVGWQRYRALIQTLAASVNIILNLIIIGQYGVDGVAWVFVVSEIVLLSGYLGLVYYWQKTERLKFGSSENVL